MQACGNDYIFFDCFSQEIKNPEKLSVKLSDRHYGIGGDGIILICPSKIADAKMRMFNADGSEGKMCGNGIRCVGKYFLNKYKPKKDEITIETASGIKSLKANFENEKVKSLTVDMGRAEFFPRLIPVNLDLDSAINILAKIAGKTYQITCLSIGNPHCVVFCDSIADLNLEEIGPQFENNELFPEKINTEFVKINKANLIEMRVWERGSGETLACGTGACAAAVAAIKNGYFKKDEDIIVKLRGGELIIRYTEKTVFMTGTAEKVFEGAVEV
jgi:carbamoyl-phosphate synthase large subunit